MTSTILISPVCLSSSMAGLNRRRSSPFKRPDTRNPVTPCGTSVNTSIGMGAPFGLLLILLDGVHAVLFRDLGRPRVRDDDVVDAVDVDRVDGIHRDVVDHAGDREAGAMTGDVDRHLTAV